MPDDCYYMTWLPICYVTATMLHDCFYAIMLIDYQYHEYALWLSLCYVTATVLHDSFSATWLPLCYKTALWLKLCYITSSTLHECHNMLHHLHDCYYVSHFAASLIFKYIHVLSQCSQDLTILSILRCPLMSQDFTILIHVVWCL